MKMTLTGIIVFVTIGAAIGYAAASIRAQGESIHHCEQCLGLSDRHDAGHDKAGEPTVPPRVLRAIREAAEVIGTCDGSRVTGDEPQDTSDERRETSDDLTDGPRVWVNLDVIEVIETGHLPPDLRDEAIGAAGERGRYQITEGAWGDTMQWLKRNRGYRVGWLWEVRAHESGYAKVIAGTYINEILPRWLTCARLDKQDSTRAVPDSLDARVAAYNAGAKRVRQAYVLSATDHAAKGDWRAYLPASTRVYLKRYHDVAAKLETTKEPQMNADERGFLGPRDER